MRLPAIIFALHAVLVPQLLVAQDSIGGETSEFVQPVAEGVERPLDPQSSTHCQEFPPEACGELPFQINGTRKFAYDDNKFCPGGPQRACVRVQGDDPNPDGFVNAVGCKFHVYVPMDCGTIAHIPLCDVESATIRVFDPDGQQVFLTGQNTAVTGKGCAAGGVGSNPLRFDRQGFELSWEPAPGRCNSTDTQSPGDRSLMDIWFTGEDDSLPGDTLCGVYTIEFESFAGCGWELFANCDGTNTPNFFLYDDLCLAEAAVQPLPELILDNFETEVDACSIDYCVEVRNEGCSESDSFEVHVREPQFGTEDIHIVSGMLAASTQLLCGTLEIDSSLQGTDVVIEAIVDPLNEIVECREDPSASSCNPSSGADRVTASEFVEVCNQPPVCDAGVPYLQECAGEVTQVLLDGSGSFDPDGDELTYLWESDCLGSLDQDTGDPLATLHLDSSELVCATDCSATLTVSDGRESVSCGQTVRVEDTTPPAFQAVPEDLDMECPSEGGADADHPEIVAWRNAFAGSDTCSPVQEADDMPPFFQTGCQEGNATPVTVTLRDRCGLESSETRAVIVRDTTAPVFDFVPEDLLVECAEPGGASRSHPDIQDWLGSPTGSDVCHSTSQGNNAPPFFDAGCGAGMATPVAFTLRDACDLETNESRSVIVQDTTPPDFSNVPDDLTMECVADGGAPGDHPAVQRWLSEFEGSDICFATRNSDDVPGFLPAGCAPGEETPVRVTIADECDLESHRDRSIFVQDTTAPAFLNVPDPLTVECSQHGGTPSSDPQIQAWRAEFVAEDACFEHTEADNMPGLFPAGCAPGQETPVDVVATDICQLSSTATQSVFVQDTLPPTVESIDFDGSCLWPPNHKYVCIEDIQSQVHAVDICDPDPQAMLTGCGSDQPDDAKDDDYPGDNGDGHTVDDCIVEEVGQTVCARAERLGTDPEGRLYTPQILVSDNCDNGVTVEAELHVPHDQSPSRKDCLRPNSPGRR